MKDRNIMPNDRERTVIPGKYIVSTSDRSGRITSVNDAFVAYSGYSREEMLGKQHNLIRHPDMPRAIFWLAWNALEAGEDFYGYVKNLCHDGGFYWVFAHILPEFDAEGDIVGYKSIRREANSRAIAAVVPLYADMLAAEQAAGPKEAIAAGLSVLKQYLSAHRQSYEQMVSSL